MASRRSVIASFIPSSPLVALLGMRVVSLGDDEATLELPFQPSLATLEDVVHGGAIASLVDTAGMAATWASDEEATSLRGSTVTLDVRYVAAARGRDLTAHAVVVRRGRSLVFSEVRVTEPDGRLVATGTVVQQLG
ncbi:MAG TPA: PaaI family thioesterase [Solirubrobacter sp.]|nr:PaaI family thioesterase [Solirubrobacter sp.]